MRYDSILSQEITWKKWLLLGMKCVRKTDFIRIGILLPAGAAAGLILPVLSQELYQNYLPQRDQQGFFRLGMFLFIFAVGNLAVLILRNLSIFQGGRTVEYAIQSVVCEKIFDLPENYFAEYGAGDLAKRMIEISLWFRGVWNAAVNIILSGCLSLFYLWRMFASSMKLTGIVAGILGILLLLTIFLGICSLQYQKQKEELEGEAAARVYQLLKGITRIRVTATEAQMQKVYEKPYLQSKMSAHQKGRLKAMAMAVSVAASGICAIAVYQAASKGISDGQMGMFLAFFTALNFCCAAVNQTAEGILEILDILPLYRRCQLILEAIPDHEEEVEMPLRLSGELEVKAVSFAYGKESVLQDISFHIKQGESVGIAGASGCGKSTLLRLLLGFEQPIKGTIFYDGQNIKDWNLEALRQNFGVVLQDDKLIPGSIYKNITMAAAETAEEAVEQVLKEVGLLEEIKQMPMGWHTILTEDSEVISKGQKQRILLARALIRNPRILFLDEATSALDYHNQQKISQVLLEKGITCIVIAHYPKVLAACDRILVMQQGRILEQGSYQKLMSEKGLFYRLQDC